MAAIEYSMTFLSMVIGLVVFLFVGRWSTQIKNSKDISFSLTLIIWSVLLFLFLIFRWFWDFNYRLGDFNSPGITILFLLRPIILYFCVDLLLPETHTPHQKEYFNSIGKKFFILVTILWLYEIFIWSLYVGYRIFEFPRPLIFLNLGFSIVLIFYRKPWFVFVGTIMSSMFVLFYFLAVFLSL